MIILLEIPGAAILAALFLNESLPWGTYLGLAFIMAGLAVVVLFQNRSAHGRKRRTSATPLRPSAPPQE
jgi:drug/metabolite transporter (DMT)-like permease